MEEKYNISTKTIADELEIQHSSIMRLANKYEYVLKKFGKIEFNQVSSNQGAGGRPSSIFYLNENQRKALIMLIRNTNKSVRVKTEILEEILK